MSKDEAQQRGVAVLVAGSALAMVSILGLFVSCTFPNTTCRWGVDVSPLSAVLALAAAFLAGGMIVLGVIAYPIGLMLFRRRHLRMWSMCLIGSLAAMAPVLVLCGAANIFMFRCFLAVPVGIGGAFAGAILWLRVFRHLTLVRADAPQAARGST